MKTWRGLAAVLCVVLLAPACGGERVTAEDRLREAIATTESLSRRLSYTDSTREVSYEVGVTVEDDLRYAARLSIDDTDAYREVVQDDTLTVRVLDPRALEVLEQSAAAEQVAGAVDVADEGSADAVDAPTTKTDIAEPSVADPDAADPDANAVDAREVKTQLLSGVWVRDELGAPPLLTGGSERDLGDDPIADALTVFDHVRSAIGQSADVVKFDESSLAYRPDEDPFPLPDEAAGEIRYDLDRPPLPRPQDAGPSGSRQPPSIEHFRKLSVYVRDGRVVKVLELIEVHTLLDELRSRFGVEVEPDASADLQAEQAMEQVNNIRLELGEDPIRVRAMSFEISDLGEELRVTPPAEATVASLALLQNRGSKAGSVEALLAEDAPETEAAVPPPVVAPPPSPPAVTPSPTGSPAASPS